MSLPGDVTTCTLTFGPYTDAEGGTQFEGMKGTIVPSTTVRHIASGQVIVQEPITVTIGGDGKASVALPHTDLTVATPTGFTYTLAWAVGRYDPSPGGLGPQPVSFALPTAAGFTTPYDALVPSQSTPGVAVPVAVSDASVAAVVTSPLTKAVLDANYDAAGAAAAVQSGLDASASGLVANSGSATNAALRAAIDAEITAQGSNATTLTVATAVTTAGALVVGKHNPVDATSGALTMTLPTGTSGKLLSVEKEDSTTNAVTLSGNIRGVGSSSIQLVWAKETLLLASDSSGSWWPVAGHKTKASLDAAYVAIQIPAGLTGAKSYEPDLQSYGLSGLSLRNFRAAMTRQEPGAIFGNTPGAAARILALGHSIPLGGSAHSPLWNYSYPGRLYEMLSRSFIGAGQGAHLSSTGGVNDERVTFAGTWTDDTARGLWGHAKTATGTGSTLTYGPVVADSFVILYVANAAAGTFSWSVSDGGSGTVNATAGSESVVAVTVNASSVGLASRTLTLTAPASGNFTPLVVIPQRKNVGGVQVVKAGYSGQYASGLSTGNATAGNVATTIALAPDVVILDILTNDYGTGATPTAPTTWHDQLSTFITAVRAANPKTDFVVVVDPNPQAPRDGQSTYTWDQYRQQAYKLADELGVVVVDITDRWGNWTTANASALMSDDYHPNDAGHYDIAHALYEALFRSWRTTLGGGANSFVGGQKVVADAVGTVPLTLQGAPGQTADYVQFLNNSNGVSAKLTAGGSFQVGSIRAAAGTGATLSFSSNAVQILSNVAGSPTFIVKRVSSQTADLVQVLAEDGTTVLASVTKDGVIRPVQTTTAGRPTAAAGNTGGMVFDTTLGKPIWSTGSAWVDATGATV